MTTDEELLFLTVDEVIVLHTDQLRLFGGSERHSDEEDRFIAIGPINEGWSSSSGLNAKVTSSASFPPDGRLGPNRSSFAHTFGDQYDLHP